MVGRGCRQGFCRFCRFEFGDCLQDSTAASPPAKLTGPAWISGDPSDVAPTKPTEPVLMVLQVRFLPNPPRWGASVSIQPLAPLHRKRLNWGNSPVGDKPQSPCASTRQPSATFTNAAATSSARYTGTRRITATCSLMTYECRPFGSNSANTASIAATASRV